MTAGVETAAVSRSRRVGTFVSLVKALGLTWVRDRAQVFFNLLLPLMFLVLLANVFSGGAGSASQVLTVGAVPVLDHAAEGEFVVASVGSVEEGLEALADGDAAALVVQEGDQVIVYYSQTDATAGAIAESRLTALVDGRNVAVLSEAAPEVPVLALEKGAAEDRSMRPVQYLAPGILAWGIAISGVFGAAGTIVDWKRDKLLRRLRLTPASAGTFVGARITVSLAVALLQMVVFLAVAAVMGLRLSAWTWFAVPLVLLGTAAFLSIGVVLGGIAKTGPGAAGLSNLVTMPMAFVSGAFWPLSLSPQWVQWVSTVSPMRYLNEALQQVVVYGESPAAVLPQIGFLAGFAVVVGVFAWKTFKFDEL
jgi:ABC-2 type transport system permease protein